MALEKHERTFHSRTQKTLTFRTIIPGPSRSADDFTSGRAGVMAEGIITWPAEDLAADPVVVRGTGHAVRQPQVGPSRVPVGEAPALLLVHPGAPDVRYALLRHPRD